MYQWQIEGVVDIEKSNQWLDKAGLNDSTEALISEHKIQIHRLGSTKPGKTPGVNCVKIPLKKIQHTKARC